MDNEIFAVLPQFAENAHLDETNYSALYQQSINNPDDFWQKQANRHLHWFSTWQQITEVNDQGQVSWFKGAKLNVAYNCIDRHLATQADKTAILFENDDGSRPRNITYQALYEEVNQLANLFKSRNIKKGDRVCIYMPMIPEAVFAMLACARIGAVHCVVFGGFSAESLKERILDAECGLIITVNQSYRGGKLLKLKDNVDKAIQDLDLVHTCLVLNQRGETALNARDIDYQESVKTQSTDCESIAMDAEDPLFILYTSGSTGQPKGVLHTTAGYLLGASLSFYYVFDYQKEDVYWCTADVGWITGHSYVTYGPLANGATTLIYEGIPNYPNASRCWEIVDKYNVSIFYTAPTAIRSLMAAGDHFLKHSKRDSLRLLGTVGEPINPEVWHWYYEKVGKNQCPIVDTWWQTETGSILIAPLPGATALKPGSATRPFFGIQPVILDQNGNEKDGEAEGILAIKSSWPSQLRTLYNDHDRFISTYMKPFEGYYFTGDGARRDADGYYWLTGRVDDVLNVSGHRIGTAEIESALVLHQNIAEAAVVGVVDDIKGEQIYCYVKTLDDIEPSASLQQALKEIVVKEIGAIARPYQIQWVDELPKTRSGKIMRRILRKIANDETESLGDVSTLAVPSVVDEIIAGRIKMLAAI